MKKIEAIILTKNEEKVIDITTKEKVEKISNWIKISLKKRSNLS
jgi:hypothetical protein